MHTFRPTLLATALATLTAPALSHAMDGSPEILSAYHGAYLTPANAQAFCGPAVNTVGIGGMPVVFREPIQATGPLGTLDPALFEVTVGDRVVTPVCATLAPAVGAGENRTVALFGDFGLGGTDVPTAVEVVGDVFTTSGTSLHGARTEAVSPIDAPSGLLKAEAFDPADGVIPTSTLGDGSQQVFCPAAKTSLVVKLTFSGGISGPDGTRLDATAAASTLLTVVDAAGERTVLQPFAIRDQDNDNHIDLCFDNAAGLTPVVVAVFGQTFFGPYDVPNPAGAVVVENAMQPLLR